MTELVQNPVHAKNKPPTDPGGSDAALVAQAKAADAQAFDLLYRRHVQHVHNFVALNVENREVALDITQTIWLRALANLHQCRHDDRFLGWLFAIARNVIADEHRSRKHVIDQFAITDVQLRQIEEEGLDKEWPPLNEEVVPHVVTQG